VAQTTREIRRRRRGLWAALGVAAALGAGCSRPKPAGPLAPLNFSLPDAGGRTVSLADFKGRPLLVNFWATYCEPCKAEMPALIALTDEFKSNHLMVLGISAGDTPAEIRAFQKDFPQQFPSNYPLLAGVGHDDLLEAFGADVAVPVTWLIRSDGTVAEKAEGPQTREWFEAHLKAMF